jgi:NAD(P)-dependent dehydrogenase (short-subunit alcohol dehydrogenase family)
VNAPISAAAAPNPDVALVTGTSSGFGRVIAAALNERGYRVYGTSRSSRGAPPPGVRPLTMNVDDAASVQSAIAELIADAGRIDVLINNAGFGIAGAIEDTSDQEARAQIETNLFGTHRVTRAVVPHMRRQGRGRIVNVSSLAGLVAIPYQAFYCASKHAIEGYTEALRMELRPFGIHVSMIEPGDFATSFTANRRMTAATTPDSPNYQRCTGAVARMQQDEQRYTDLTPVVKAVLRALDAPKPNLRYPVAVAVQRVLVALKPFVPQRLFEYLIMDNYKLT